MQVLIVGVDVAKDALHVAFQLKGHDKPLDKGCRVDNTPKGWQQAADMLSAMSRRHTCEHVAIFLEATGVYGERFCHAMLEREGTSVHLVPPNRMKYYLQAVSYRGKTDELDARGIARFGAHHDWPAWQSPEPEVDELRQLRRAIEQLQKVSQQLENRMHADQYRQRPSEAVAETYTRLLAELESAVATLESQAKEVVRSNGALKQRDRLLRTIPGVGPALAQAMLALVGTDLPESPKHLVGRVGVAPRPYESGSSVWGKASISPAQGRLERSILYMGTLSAKTFNPVIAEFYQRLTAAGKPHQVAMTACMRRMLHLVYGVLKHMQAFDPDKATAGRPKLPIAA